MQDYEDYDALGLAALVQEGELDARARCSTPRSSARRSGTRA